MYPVVRRVNEVNIRVSYVSPKYRDDFYNCPAPFRIIRWLRVNRSTIISKLINHLVPICTFLADKRVVGRMRTLLYYEITFIHRDQLMVIKSIIIFDDSAFMLENRKTHANTGQSVRMIQLKWMIRKQWMISWPSPVYLSRFKALRLTFYQYKHEIRIFLLS